MKLLAVIGNPISHSLSPIMHNAAIQAFGLDFKYEARCLSVENFAQEIQKLKDENIAGFNATIPFKQAIIPLLDNIDDIARKIGAVNTIVNENGKFKGYNTDYFGFSWPINELISNKNVTILGAGGSSYAVALALLDKGVNQLVIANRSLQKADALREHLGDSRVTTMTLDDPKLIHALKKSDLIVNTTSLGMKGAQENLSPVKDFSWINPNQLCYDIIYTPPKTIFLNECEKRGAKIMNGTTMLAAQGALAFKQMTSCNQSEERIYKIMRNALEEELKKRANKI